jgi:hypothetical protein
MRAALHHHPPSYPISWRGPADPDDLWKFYAFCFCFNFCIYCFFCGWVMVSIGDPLSRVFVLMLCVPVSIQPLQRGCYFGQGWRLPNRVMPLFFTDLVLSLPCADALALSKVDRAGTFSVPLELKKHPFPPWLPIRHCNIRLFGFIVGCPRLCFSLCIPSLLLWNERCFYKKKKETSTYFALD